MEKWVPYGRRLIPNHILLCQLCYVVLGKPLNLTFWKSRALYKPTTYTDYTRSRSGFEITYPLQFLCCDRVEVWCFNAANLEMQHWRTKHQSLFICITVCDWMSVYVLVGIALTLGDWDVCLLTRLLNALLSISFDNCPTTLLLPSKSGYSFICLFVWMFY